MTTRNVLFAAAAIAAVLGMQSAAHALTMTECSAKYKDAKAVGTLSSGAAASDSTVVAANAVFPTAVDAKYSSEKPGRARRKT